LAAAADAGFETLEARGIGLDKSVERIEAEALIFYFYFHFSPPIPPSLC
jgi:hypothetical protein